VHVYQAHECSGTLAETDEMRPEWFGINSMPFDQMWSDDCFWWPFVLSGDLFVGRFWFKADQVTITRSELNRVDTLDFAPLTDKSGL
ncbi:hypothetical protein H4R19_005588, partial [Coemansia spiralis]